jgi:hypothetical protein
MDETGRMSAQEWFWCLEHDSAEPADHACPPDRRLGPYPSRAAAEHWKEQFEARNRAWDEADAEWEGDD